MVRTTPGADVAQLHAWGVAQRAGGSDAFYLLAREGETVVGGAQIIVRRGLVGRVGFVAYGPLVSSRASRAAVLPALAQALATYARSAVRGLFIQPLDGTDVTEALLACGFRISRQRIFPHHAVRIGLRTPVPPTSETASDRPPESGRQEDLVVRRGGQPDVETLLELNRRSVASVERITPEFVRTLYQGLGHRGEAEIFVAEYCSTPIAAQLLTVCGGLVRQKAIGVDPHWQTTGLAALDRHTVQWAQTRGLCEFEVGAVNRAHDQYAIPGKVHFYPQAVEFVPSLPLRYVLGRSPRLRWP